MSPVRDSTRKANGVALMFLNRDLDLFLLIPDTLFDTDTRHSQKIDV
jgi:hypothetical protein